MHQQIDKIMRKLLFFTLAFATMGLSAQNLKMYSFDTLVVGDAATDGDIYGYATVENVSNIPLDIRFKRIDGNYNALTDSNAICWSLCFRPEVSVSPTAFTRTLQPGDTGIAITHVYPDLDGYTRQGDITYVFFNQYDESDSVAYTVTYRVNGQPIGLNEVKKPSIQIYPNPIRGRAQVKYDLSNAQNGSFELISLVGSKVFRKNLNTSEGSFELPVEGLSAGVYFYTLKADGQVVSTKKLVIE